MKAYFRWQPRQWLVGFHYNGRGFTTRWSITFCLGPVSFHVMRMLIDHGVLYTEEL